jgi:hypothetical protein
MFKSHWQEGDTESRKEEKPQEELLANVAKKNIPSQDPLTSPLVDVIHSFLLQWLCCMAHLCRTEVWVKRGIQLR